MQIKAVGFDLGGVIIQNATHVFFEKTVKEFNVSLDKLRAAFDKYHPQHEKGEIDAEAFWRGVCQELGVTYNPSVQTLWTEHFIEDTPPIPGMIELVEQLKTAGYKVGLLSNTTDQHVPINRTRHIFEHFDVALMSNEIHARKPEKEAYQKLLEGLGTQAGETVFIDDLSENVAGASAVGMRGLKFEGREPLIAQLSQLGVKL